VIQPKIKKEIYTCQPHGRVCIGTEYILQKDEPAPKVETASNELDDLVKNKPTVLPRPKAESSNNGLDFLKIKTEINHWAHRDIGRRERKIIVFNS
jgi:hypothetical protein